MALPDFNVEIVDGSGALPDYRVAAVAEDASPRPDYILAEASPADYRVQIVAEDASPQPDFRVYGLDTNNFLVAMPAVATYTRTGAATGLTSAGTLESFAADAPQRTDRGLALEPAATNPLLNSADATLWAGTNGCTMVKLAQTFAPFERVSLASAGSLNNRIRAAAVSLVAAEVSTVSYIFDLGTSGIVRVFLDGTSSASASRAVDGTWSYIAGTNGEFSGAVERVLTGSIRMVTLTLTALVTGSFQLGAGPGSDTIGQTSHQHFAQLEPGTVATSPIVTSGVAATRGLPVFTETVPAGRTKALLTYADDSTTLVEGLTPGGTFDVVAAVLGASKGRFGASELVTRKWQA